MSNTKKPFEEMTDAEWLQYYRDTYGTPRETPPLSADAQYQQQSHRLDEYYNAQSEAYKQSKAQQKEDAYVLYQRMQKYVPEYLKSLGMTGLGVSESYASQATNDYQNSLSGIEQAYARDQSALDQEKFDRQSDLEAAYLTNKQNEQAVLSESVYEPKFIEYQTAMDIEKDKNGGYVTQETYDKVMEWLASVEGKIPDVTYKSILATMEQNYQPKPTPEASAPSTNPDASTNATQGKDGGVRVNGKLFYLPNQKTPYKERIYWDHVAWRDMGEVTKAAASYFGGVENIPDGTVYALEKPNGKTVYFKYGEGLYGKKGWMRQDAENFEGNN